MLVIKKKYLKKVLQDLMEEAQYFSTVEAYDLIKTYARDNGIELKNYD